MDTKRYLFTLTLTLLSTPLLGGDLFLGIRTWHADWSPGALRNLENRSREGTVWSLLTGQRRLAIIPFAADDVGGFYSGPVLSYITDDRRLSFSLVALKGNSGSQGMTGVELSQTETQTTDLLDTRTIGERTKPFRQDLDLTIGYGLTPRLKIFAGFKRQGYEYDIRPIGAFTRSGVVQRGLPAEENIMGYGMATGNRYLKHLYSGPAGGIAYSFPVSEKGSLAVSLGYFKASGSMEEKLGILIFASIAGDVSGRFNTYFFNLDRISTTLVLRALTLELTYTTPVSDSVYLQFGYRNQYSWMDLQYTWADDSFSYSPQDGLEWQRSPFLGDKIIDRFQGFSFSFLYRV